MGGQLQAGPPSVSLRSTGLKTLPPGLRGRTSPRTDTYWGTLKSARCASVRQKRVDVQGRAGPGDDDRPDLLAHHRVGHPDDGNLEDPRRTGEGVLDLDAVDVLAAAVDQVLGPVDDVGEAVGIQSCQAPVRSHRAERSHNSCFGSRAPARRETSEELHVHPSTLDKRLERIAQLTGIDVHTTHGVALLQTALVAYEMEFAGPGAELGAQLQM